jgi:hypothetical protein
MLKVSSCRKRREKKRFSRKRTRLTMSEPQRSKRSHVSSSQSLSDDSSGGKDLSEDSIPGPEPSISDDKDIKRLRLQLKSQVLAKHLRAVLSSKTTTEKLKATQAAKTTAAARRLTNVTRRYEAQHFALTLRDLNSRSCCQAVEL